MEALAVATSFDLICEPSKLRHHKVRDLVLKGLKESMPQPGQAESKLQALVDEAEEKMVNVLGKWAQRQVGRISAEYYAESWDYMLWGWYKANYGVTKNCPWPHPDNQHTHIGPLSPEYQRFTESQFVEKEQIPRDQSVARSSSAIPDAPRPEPGQHQGEKSTDRESLHQKLSAMREKSAQDERVKVAMRVVTIIMESRTGTDGAALDWKVLGDKLSCLIVESGHVGSRPRWIQESCSEWKKQNLAEDSREQVIFDRELNSWYSGILDFVQSQE